MTTTRILTRMAAATALLATAFSTCSHAQGIRIGNRLIPTSSIPYPQDAGVRAHTHIEMLLGPPGGQVGFFGGLGPGGGMTPAQLKAVYNLPSTGGSQIIAIVDAYHDPNALSDFNTFSKQFSLPQETSATATSSTNHVFQVLYAGGTQPPADSTGGWELEEGLDIEWAHAIAPIAKILLVEAASSSLSALMTAENVASAYVDGNGLSAVEITNSWGTSEFEGETTYDTNFSASSAVFFFSAGDVGGAVEYPSASPYVVSVGGTTVTTNSSGSFLSEAGWSDGGGGPSGYEPRPGFQNAISARVGSWRGTPDIASDANPSTGVCEYDSYPYEGSTLGWVDTGGTSAASPVMAGASNLAGTAQGTFPAGAQALLSTVYSNLGSTDFRDITTGNNGHAAGPGWDFVTGVGTLQGLAGLQSGGSAQLSVSSISPSSATAGGTAFTLSVSGVGFVAGSVVQWNGVALSTTYVSSQQLAAAVPAGNIQAAGSASVTVSNPGAAQSNSVTFTIKSTGGSGPVLNSLSPNSARRGSRSSMISLQGANFTPGCQVLWSFGGAIYTLSVNYVSANQLSAMVPTNLLATEGAASVMVNNPAAGGGSSSSQTFTISH